MMPKSTAPTESRLALSPMHHQQDGGEEQREWNVQAHDDCAAKVAQEDPLDQENQQASEDQVVQDRMRGERDQGRPVVVTAQLLLRAEDCRRDSASGSLPRPWESCRRFFPFVFAPRLSPDNVVVMVAA